LILNARRSFLKSSFLSIGVIVTLQGELFGAVSPLETLSLVQKDLFPFCEELGVNTPAYLGIVLKHSRITDTDKIFLRNGVQWLNEEALETNSNIYSKLSSSQRQTVLQSISQKKWGERWITAMLGYTMEAIFSDRIYGINPQNAGEKWVGHKAGFPRPSKAFV
jgi:gluconate 2-dehydrogenase gamma chain